MTSKLLFGLALALALPASPARGQNFFANYQSCIALHVIPANSLPSGTRCSPMVIASTVAAGAPGTSQNGDYFWTYLLVCHGSDSTGIGGMEMGIRYPAAIVVHDWTLCADLQFPDAIWPASEGSNLLTWSTAHCQLTRSEPLVPRTVIAIGGYFYMGAYAPSQISVIPRPVSGLAQVADCQSRVDNHTGKIPSHLGVAGFGGVIGYNSCSQGVPVQAASWGSIKSLVR